MLRTFAVRLGAFVMAFVVAVGLLRGGGSYFFCPMMNEVFDAPCCDEHRDEGDRDVSGVRTPDCCQAKRLATLPRWTASSVPDVAPSPFVASLPPALDPSAVRARARLGRFAQPARASPPTANERRADLMVWHS